MPKIDWKLPVDVPFDSNQLVGVHHRRWSWPSGCGSCMRHTPLGLQMRAVVDRADLAQTRGVERAHDVALRVGDRHDARRPRRSRGRADHRLARPGRRSSRSTFVAAAAAVLGGLRSIPLAFLGGLLLGVAENLVAGYATSPRTSRGFNSSVPFVLLLVGLVVMARDRSRRGGSAADEAPPPDYLADLPLWRRALPWTLAVAFLIVYVLVLANDFWVGRDRHRAHAVADLPVVRRGHRPGGHGQPGPGHVRARGRPHHRHAHQPVRVGVPPRHDASASRSPCCSSSVVALPALRLGGLPLALATLALAFLGDQVLFQWNWLRNTQSGLDDPPPGDRPVRHERTTRRSRCSCCCSSAIVVLLIRNLKRSSWGRAIAADAVVGDRGEHLGRVGAAREARCVRPVRGDRRRRVACSTRRSSRASPTSTVTVVTGLLWLATVVLFGIRRPAAAVLAGIVSAVSPVILQSGFHCRTCRRFLSWNGTRRPRSPRSCSVSVRCSSPATPTGHLDHRGPELRPAHEAPGQRRPRSAYRRRRHRRRSAAGRGAADRRRRRAQRQRARRRAGAVRAATSHGADPTGDAVLVMQGVHAGYDEVEVLHGIDLVVRAGDDHRAARRQRQRQVDAVLDDLRAGAAAGRVDHRRRRRRVGGGPLPAARNGVLVAPESRGIFPGLSVEENLMLRLPSAPTASRCTSGSRCSRERRRLPAGSLSGGEQQMLALAPGAGEPAERARRRRADARPRAAHRRPR